MKNDIAYYIERTVHIESEGVSVESKLTIELPKINDPDETCYCLCSCEPIFKDIRIYGEDQLSALINGLWFCSERFKTSNVRSVSWLVPGDRGGLDCITEPKIYEEHDE